MLTDDDATGELNCRAFTLDHRETHSAALYAGVVGCHGNE